jgi:Zn-dependent protease
MVSMKIYTAFREVGKTVKCQQCERETFMPFRCPFCQGYFCVEHRLPENHACPEYWRTKVLRREEPSIPVLDEAPEYPIPRVHEPTRPEGVLWFSSTELKHLALGILLVMAVGLSIIFGISLDVSALVAFAIIFTFSFIVHELAHKLTAQRYGLWAEFRLIPIGVLMTLFSILFPFKFVSPGAVMVAGYGSRENLGKVSLAGPLTNLALSILSLGVASFSFDALYLIASYSALFNAYMAFFNLIPFGIFDGATVFRWNKGVWAATFITSLALLIWTFAFVISLI